MCLCVYVALFSCLTSSTCFEVSQNRTPTRTSAHTHTRAVAGGLRWCLWGPSPPLLPPPSLPMFSPFVKQSSRGFTTHTHTRTDTDLSRGRGLPCVRRRDGEQLTWSTCTTCASHRLQPCPSPLSAREGGDGRLCTSISSPAVHSHGSSACPPLSPTLTRAGVHTGGRRVRAPDTHVSLPSTDAAALNALTLSQTGPTPTHPSASATACLDSTLSELHRSSDLHTEYTHTQPHAQTRAQQQQQQQLDVARAYS